MGESLNAEGQSAQRMGKPGGRRWAGSDPAPAVFSGDVPRAVSTEPRTAGMLIIRRFSSSLSLVVQ